MLILSLLFIKHLVADFFIQPPYMYLNKGNLFHPGGYYHAFNHAFLTWLILLAFSSVTPTILLVIFIVEFVVHYLMDFTKVNVCKKYGYGPTTHEQWFWWLGIDQTIHSLTYVWIAWYIL